MCEVKQMDRKKNSIGDGSETHSRSKTFLVKSEQSSFQTLILFKQNA